MMTSSSMRDADRLVPVRVNYSQTRQKYAKGGMAKQAEGVRNKGRMGDDMVVHVNQREFQEMCGRWGKPTINPDTKLPEFFLGDIFGAIGSAVTTGAGYLPFIGDAAKDILTNNPGIAQAVGSAALGAGAGQLLGGNTKSTLLGGALGAISPSLFGGASIFGGGGREAAGGITNISGTGDLPDGATITEGKEGATAAATKSGAGGLGGALTSKSTMAPIIGALMLANVLGQSRGPSKDQKKAEAANDAAQVQFNRRIEPVNFNRQSTPFQGDPRRYGMGGQQFNGWYSGNSIGKPEGFAEGGGVMRGGLEAAMGSRFVQGPGGAREDKIPAMLSNNEYVLTAEEMALLGDGDPEAGAKRMDQMRANLRKHKGGALARGKISPNAKAPHQYL